MLCQLCDRDCPALTVHHLIPRQHTKRKKQPPGPTIDICAACHKQIHTLFDNRQLARELNTLAALKAQPQLMRFVAWVQRQDPNRKVRSYRSR